MMALTETQQMIIEECDILKELLLDKNRKYGDSAINPKRIFSKASAAEQIKVRLDDKISRLINQQSDEDEDVIQDLLGYLILYRIAIKKGNDNGKDKQKQNEDVEAEREEYQPASGTKSPGPVIKNEYALDARDAFVITTNDAAGSRYYLPSEGACYGGIRYY